MNRGLEDNEPRFTFAIRKWTPEQEKNVVLARKCLSDIIIRWYEEEVGLMDEKKERCCLTCVSCRLVDAYGPYGYEGYCKKTGIYLRTLEDRLCEKYEEE